MKDYNKNMTGRLKCGEYSQGAILVVDDDPGLLKLYRKILKGYPEAVYFSDGVEALDFIAEAGFIGLAFVDYFLPGASGLKIVEDLKRKFPGSDVIVITGLDDVQAAVKAIRAGAANYMVKPFKSAELLAIVERNRESQRLRRENEALRGLLRDRGRRGAVIGASPGIRRVLEMVEAAAPLDATVLLLGETGTGKDLLARLIHRESPRAARPFINADLSALNERLIESDLFGHEKGAFTGAWETHRGKFERAEGGTIFLNEIGTLGLNGQQKLLRVLEDREMERVGGSGTLKVDVRVIAAASSNLEKDAASGLFRADLLYRLNMFTIRIPPLRERREDIPLLIEHFLRVHCAKYERTCPVPSSLLIEQMTGHSWPGNVRELENTVERAVIAGDFSVLNFSVFSPASVGKESRRLETLEKEAILVALQETSANIARAARKLGISRSTLYGKLKKHGISGSV